MDDFDRVIEARNLEARYNELPEVSFVELENKVKSCFLIKDPGIIKILVGTVIANRLSGDPVWLFLVAPSGGLKSEMIQALNVVPEVYALSKFTPQTLISGHGKEQSLLLRLNKEGKTILSMKDFTTILQMDFVARNDILAQLREVYDGAFKKAFGARGEGNNEVSWTGKLGFVAGVTPIVDVTQGIYSALGERFLQYRIIQPPRKETAKKVLENSTRIKDIRESVKDAVAGFLKSVKIPTDLPEILEEDKEMIIEVSNFATLARSSVIRESYHTRAIEYKPESEMPTRFINQINLLAYAFMIINGGQLSSDDRHILCKISLDSIPQLRRTVLEVFATTNDGMTCRDVAMKLGYPTNTIRRVLEDLNALGILNRKSAKDHTDLPREQEDVQNDDHIDLRADVWTLQSDFSNLLSKYANQN